MMMATVIFSTLVSVVLLLTLTGGGLFPASLVLAALVMGGLAAVASYRNSRTMARGGAPRTRPHLEIILGLILLSTLLTALPLPPALDPLTGSLRHGQNQAVVNAIHEAAQCGAPTLLEEPWFCLSRNRAGTLRFFLLLAAAMGAGLLTAALPVKGKKIFLAFLAMLGTAVGIAGYLGQWIIPQGDTLWWFIPVPHAPTSPVGCFLNRNHFGGFVAMLCPVALALAADAIATRRWLPVIPYSALTVLMAAIVSMSLSRGAMLALIAGLCTITLIITFRHRWLWGVLLAGLILAGTSLALTQIPAIRERLAGIHNPTQLASVNSRLNEWQESLRVWPHYPLIGTGANALRMVYPQYRETSIGARLIHAENEYIQLVAEGGLIGIALAGLLIWALLRRIRQNPAPIPDLISTAVAGALSVTAVHCLFDFPAHLPLYALVMGALTGLLLTPASGLTGVARFAAMLPSMTAIIGTLLIACQHPADIKRMDDPNHLFQASNRELHRALIWAPTSPAWLYLGRSMYKEGALTANGPLCQQAESMMSRAAELDPRNYRLWYEIGQVRLELKDHERAAEAFRKARALRAWLTPPAIPGRPAL